MFMSGTFRAESFCLCPSVCEESNRCPREIAETAYHPDRDINLLLRLADSKLNAQRIVADTVRFVASRSGDAAVFTVLSVSSSSIINRTTLIKLLTHQLFV